MYNIGNGGDSLQRASSIEDLDENFLHRDCITSRDSFSSYIFSDTEGGGSLVGRAEVLNFSNGEFTKRGTLHELSEDEIAMFHEDLTTRETLYEAPAAIGSSQLTGTQNNSVSKSDHVFSRTISSSPESTQKTSTPPLNGFLGKMKVLKNLRLQTNSSPVELNTMTPSRQDKRVLEAHLTALVKTLPDTVFTNLKGENILQTLSDKIEPIYREITENNPTDTKYSSEIKASFQKCIKTLVKEGLIDEAQYKGIQSQIHQQRGICADPVVENSFTEAGITFTEKKSVVSTGGFGGEYLEQFLLEKQLTDQNESLIDTAKNPPQLRVSKNRNDTKLQGVLTNLQKHTCKIGEEVDVKMRSGVPCTHGRLYKDKKCSLRDLEGLKGSSKGGELMDIQNEIDIRIGCSTAQALTKVVASIKEMMIDPQKREIAIRTGTFLHVEQSYLSHLDKSENAMIQEEREAFKNITENLTVKFGDTESVTVDDKGKTVVTLKKEKEWEGCDEKNFSVLAPLFVQGVNEKQSLGNMTGKEDPLQDDINIESHKVLKKYMQDNFNEKDIQTGLNNLGKHFHKNAIKSFKDMDGMLLLTKITKELGGITGINCKSGKDRTGMVFCYLESRQALEVFQITKKATVEKATAYANKVQDNLASGISYDITGLNTGEDNGYAFNILQRQFLPEVFRVDPKLCGNVGS